MFSHGSVVFFFSLIAEKYFFVWMAHMLFILSPVNGHFGLLGIKLLQMFLYMCFCEHVHLFLLVVYPGVGFLDGRLRTCLFN